MSSNGESKTPLWQRPTLVVSQMPLDGRRADPHILIPALPFCQLTLRAMKPRGYPAALATIGDHVRARRVDLGLTLKRVGRQLGVASTTVTNWEKGRTTPDFRVMPKLIDFLGYEPVGAARVTDRGAAIVQFRRSRGISQKELAWVLGVDPGTVGKWEAGRGGPPGLLLSRVQRSRIWRGGLDAAFRECMPHAPTDLGRVGS